MARKKIVAGNWKMNMTPSQAVKLVEELKPLVVSDSVDVVYCVPAIDIVPVVEAVKGTNVQVGAENMYFEEKGAYTGEISAEMLVDAGVKYVVIGHSERRDYFKEDDVLLNKKVKKAIEAGLTPILCCGETLEQREMGVTLDWIRLQIKSDLAGVAAADVANMVIAYEPIWAIGTGKTATSDQAQEVCKAIRDCIAEVYDTDTAEAVRIQYGGSMNAGNAAELLAKKLTEKGCPKVAVNDLARCDMAEAVEDAFRYGKLVLATTTYNGDIFPFMREFINHLTERNFQNRTIGLIENGAWAPMAAKVMKGMFENSKNLTFTDTTVQIKAALNDASLAQIDALADELCK